MKTETRKQDGEPVNPLFTSKSQQILCENRSGASAVQGTPDWLKARYSLITRQGRIFLQRKPQHRPLKYCAKGDTCEFQLGRSGLVAIIDAADLQRVLDSNCFLTLKRRTERLNYVELKSFATQRYVTHLHRLILNLGSNDKAQVDHINHNGLDNRRVNLRLATVGQNRRNARANSGKQYKGVFFQGGGRLKRPWIARLKGKSFGYHATAEDAARAYDRAATKHYGRFAFLNFPPVPSPALQELLANNLGLSNKEMSTRFGD